MPAFNITNPVSVGLSTKADHYHRVFDNTLALYGGAMSYASQAVGDIPYAISTTQLAAIAPSTVSGRPLCAKGTGTKPDYTAVPVIDGLQFPATQVSSSNPNTLDDYEEGTWTPAANGVSVTVNSARYTKIGRLVHVTADVTWPATADTNQARLAGLPFTTGVDSAAAIGLNTSSNLAEAMIQTSTIFFYAAASGASARTNAQFSGANIKLSGTYTV